MPNTYEKADDHTTALVASAINRWHQVLYQTGVTVAALFIDDIDEESGESHRTLKHGGYFAAATIAITPLKQRALGIADSLMVLDAYTWHELDEDEQRALVDHELMHLSVRGIDKGLVGLNSKGQCDRSAKLDDQRRPVLKLRKHDWQLGGFAVVAKRHRLAAIEVQAVRAQLDSTTGQYAWDFDLLGAARELLDEGARRRGARIAPEPYASVPDIPDADAADADVTGLAEKLLDGGATVSRIGNRTTIEIPVDAEAAH